MHFSVLRPQKWPNPKSRKSRKPKTMKQLHQKWDFLGHQVIIRSTFGNSRMHWIDIACYILENQVRIPDSIQQERKNLQPFCMIILNYIDTNRWNFQPNYINTFCKIIYKVECFFGAPCIWNIMIQAKTYKFEIQ